MFGIIAGIVVGIGIVVTAVVAVSAAATRKEETTRLLNRYNDMLDDNNWRYPQTKENYPIKEMPQLTFERFLTLYGANPEGWHIPEADSSWYSDSSFIPYYVKTVTHKDPHKNHEWTNTIVIPVFWESWVEMEKFMNWKKKDYLYGNEAGTRKIRDQKMTELAGCLADDLQKDREKFQNELDQIRKEITLTLDPPKQKPKRKVRLSDGTEMELPGPEIVRY